MQMILLTVPEVAETMKVSQSTVRRMIRRGLITAYKLGDRGQLRIKEDDVEQYVESRRVRVENTPAPNPVVMETDE